MTRGAPLLVFAHYFGGSARSWSPLLSVLGDGFDCLAPDLPGFGDTPAPAKPSLDAYANRYTALAGGWPWIAVGHSMGGKIALAAAARRPSGLRALILIDASPQTPEPMSDEDRAASLAAYGDRRTARKQLTEIGSRLSPDILKMCIEDELRVAEPAWRWWLERGSRDDISAATAKLDFPALVIAGDDDRVLGPDTGPTIARALPRAVLKIVPDAGHLAPLERPAAVAALVHEFVVRLGA